MVLGDRLALLTEVARRINNGIELEDLLAYVQEQVEAPIAEADKTELMVVLGSLLSMVAQNEALFAQVLRTNAALARLDDLSREINQAHNVEDIVRVAAAGLSELVGADAFALYILAEGLPALLGWDAPPDAFPQTVSVLSAGGARLLGKEGADEVTLGVGSLAGRPTLVELLRGGEGAALGLMIIRRPLGAEDIAPEVRPVVSALAGHLAVSIHNARLLAEMRRHATFDDLTGLSGRRHFFTEMRREIARARRDKRPLSLLMLDADHFKAINDTYGHPAGDAVLVAMAEALVEGTRTVDICGRLGGEEMGVLLPQAGKDHALMVAERLRVAIRDTVVAWKELEIGITVSIGVATWDEPMTPEDMMQVADQALYMAKAEGRDRVISESSLNTIEIAPPG
ncbi:MAG: sensor domain-containing diguanylate cyclase [Proteobacteria bacterium]|nr:sensor domain-containing diguanylate cyclase [Pseudomonadota bacterium]